MSESVDVSRDEWFDDFAKGCSRAAHLYATAFDRMTIELGEETALALADIVLPQVVAMGEAQASQLETLRFQRQAAERERLLWEAAQQQAMTRPPMPENPW